MIESTSNTRIKNAVKLIKSPKDRKKQGRYIVEGPKMVLEAVRAGCVSEIYISDKLHGALKVNDDKTKLNNRLAGCEPAEFLNLLDNAGYEVVSDRVFAEMTDTVSPQGIIAVVCMKDMAVCDMFNAGFGIRHYCNETACMNIRRYLILEDLQDPGNLGTIFRTAEASGYNGIFMNKGTVDAYNPKVVRSTMGAVLRVPFIQLESTSGIISECHERNIRVYGAALEGDDIRNEVFDNSMAFVIGNESKGLTAETLSLCDSRIRIPMCGSVESLNASVAAGLIMYLSNLPFM